MCTVLVEEFYIIDQGQNVSVSLLYNGPNWYKQLNALVMSLFEISMPWDMPASQSTHGIHVHAFQQIITFKKIILN